MSSVTAVIGATGWLGGTICQHLAAAGKPVRALVRPTSEPARLTLLERMGADLRRGDLKEPSSLDAICEGAQAVISTASSMLSRQAGDSIQSVDLEGQLSLIEAAQRAGVEHFILLSFVPAHGNFPLQDAKRTVEQALMRSGVPHYTVLRPTFFTEVWLSPALGFDFVNARARIFGTGHGKVNWISLEDVARFAVGALASPRARDTTLELGGEEALSQLEVVRLFEEWDGRGWTLDVIPEQVLRTQADESTDPRQRSFAAMMLNVALGSQADPRPAMEVIPVHLTPVSDYVRRVRVQSLSEFRPAPP